MVNSRPEEEGRALAYVASLFFTVGLAIYAGVLYCCRSLLSQFRNRRSANWPTAPGQITTCDVRSVHGRAIDYTLGIIGYSYQAEGNYYSGYLVRQFWDEQRGWDFVDAYRDKSVLIHYKLADPNRSALSEDEQHHGAKSAQTIALLPAVPLSGGIALLWALRNVSDWAESKLQRAARSWPSVSAVVEYAEARVVDDEAHWGGELHYRYSVDGATYSDSYYFRAYGQSDAEEQVRPWRDRNIVVHYYPGDPRRSVFVPQEQTQMSAIAE